MRAMENKMANDSALSGSEGGQGGGLASYDVVIIGGALSGASTAILLLRERPDLRILVVEKSPAFTRRVGEATVEVSTYFLTRQLGLTQYLNEEHLNKQGLRFWFANDRAQTLDHVVRTRTFQRVELPEVGIVVGLAGRQEERVREHAIDEMVGGVQAIPVERPGTRPPVAIRPGGPSFEHEPAQLAQVVGRERFRLRRVVHA